MANIPLKSEQAKSGLSRLKAYGDRSYAPTSHTHSIEDVHQLQAVIDDVEGEIRTNRTNIANNTTAIANKRDKTDGVFHTSVSISTSDSGSAGRLSIGGTAISADEVDGDLHLEGGDLYDKDGNLIDGGIATYNKLGHVKAENRTTSLNVAVNEQEKDVRIDSAGKLTSVGYGNAQPSKTVNGRTTVGQAGLMSAGDKDKLDRIAAGATAIVIHYYTEAEIDALCDGAPSTSAGARPMTDAEIDEALNN